MGQENLAKKLDGSPTRTTTDCATSTITHCSKCQNNNKTSLEGRKEEKRHGDATTTTSIIPLGQVLIKAEIICLGMKLQKLFSKYKNATKNINFV